MAGKRTGTKVIPCSLKTPDPHVIFQAALIIKKGGLVVYPTDTFYGLGADPKNEKAIQRIYKVKGRSRNKPLPLILHHKKGIQDWVSRIPPLSKRLMDLFWPGPLTILFPCSKNLSPLLTAGTGKIGLRWPKAPLAAALAKEVGTAVISTSANLSGQGGLISPDSVLNDLEGRVDLVIDAGELPSSLGSTIVDATGDHILVIRKGEISIGTLQKFEINEIGE